PSGRLPSRPSASASASAARGQTNGHRPHAGLARMRSGARGLPFVATIVCCLLLLRPAYAEDHKTRAMELFQEGRAAYDRGDFVAAARAFEGSYEHIPRAAAMYNAARSWDAAHQNARAADDYQTLIERTDVSGNEAVRAKRRLAELEGQLGVLELNAPPGWKV